jgi:catechol 2,3-dioxygenase-like lactoylglutathione lyase family enzyme
MMKADQNMTQKIGYVTLLIRDYDEAIEYYTKKLRFDLLEDTQLSDEKRWVLIAPPGAKECCLLLAKAASPEQEDRIGNQTGGRVFLFLHTDDFLRQYHAMKSRGVEFLEEPREEEYGRVVVFQDLYGNKWDLLELASTVTTAIG